MDGQRTRAWASAANNNRAAVLTPFLRAKLATWHKLYKCATWYVVWCHKVRAWLLTRHCRCSVFCGRAEFRLVWPVLTFRSFWHAWEPIWNTEWKEQVTDIHWAAAGQRNAILANSKTSVTQTGVNSVFACVFVVGIWCIYCRGTMYVELAQDKSWCSSSWYKKTSPSAIMCLTDKIMDHIVGVWHRGTSY